jgi:hypothetical protein
LSDWTGIAFQLNHGTGELDRRIGSRKFATAAGKHANSDVATMRELVEWNWHCLLGDLSIQNAIAPYRSRLRIVVCMIP